MKKIKFISLMFVFVLLSCHNSEKSLSTKYKWPTSTPEAQELDPEKLKSLVQAIRDDKTYPDVDSLLIIRNGFLVLEEYFHGYDAETLHMVQSVTKSFISALVGIAIDKGFIKDANQKILGFFPDLDSIKNLDERKRSIKIQDLLTMRSGTDFYEREFGSPNFELNRLATGWDIFYLDRPMISDPGTGFRYDTGGSVLLSAILKKVNGMHADAFAEKYLFSHLDISKTFWIKNSEGYPHAGGGLHLLPRDMAKLGQLYLQNGVWQGEQIIPVQWIEESFKPHVIFRVPEDHPYKGYGYYWWILKLDPKDETKGYIYTALGLWGQFIFVIPEYDMVVVVNSDARGANEGHPITFLYTYVLPSVQDQDINK
ncbi:MAG: serine hydrolase [Candidatus Aminicenantes bacterium]|nr:serine hydrolase [Candidatus Aminicenantes bacterium]